MIGEEAVIRRKSQNWRRLEELTKKSRETFRSLSPAEIREYVRLYRQASADLASLRTQSSNPEIIIWLNELVARAYGQLHKRPRMRFFEAIQHMLETAADTFRRYVWLFVLNLVLFLGSAFGGAAIVNHVDGGRELLVSEAFDPWIQGSMDERTGEESAFASAFYASNNPRVAIITNALGSATFGVFSLYSLWNNGSMVGALGAEMARVNKLPHLLIWISPHGVSEVSGLLVASEAGMVLAIAMFRPGRRSRGDAMRLAGKDALALILLGLAMTYIAAPIEGFFSFNPRVPDALKITFAALSAAAWIAFLFGFGRNRVTEA